MAQDYGRLLGPRQRYPVRRSTPFSYEVIMSKQFKHAEYDALVDDTIKKIKELGVLKGGEYAGDDDRLANFRRNGFDQDLPMETIWRVYAAKHWDAIGQYIKDIRKGIERKRMESISGRVDDLIVYLLLFKAMVVERDRRLDTPPLHEIRSSRIDTSKAQSDF